MFKKILIILFTSLLFAGCANKDNGFSDPYYADLITFYDANTEALIDLEAANQNSLENTYIKFNNEQLVFHFDDGESSKEFKSNIACELIGDTVTCDGKLNNTNIDISMQYRKTEDNIISSISYCAFDYSKDTMLSCMTFTNEKQEKLENTFNNVTINKEGKIILSKNREEEIQKPLVDEEDFFNELEKSVISSFKDVNVRVEIKDDFKVYIEAPKGTSYNVAHYNDEFLKEWNDLIDSFDAISKEYKDILDLAGYKKMSAWIFFMNDTDDQSTLHASVDGDCAYEVYDNFDYFIEHHFPELQVEPEPKPEPKPFTNLFGTPTTICAHPGCNNYIASSGDTNCCEKHSNRCLNCGKYIDEDATYCMSCLKSSIEGKKGGCTYVYPDGHVCGKPTNKYDGLCDKHFNELNDAYNDLLGN